ncbi:hypothetical protein J540_3806, partial [Acinetobacter baumannii 1440422]
SLFFNKSLINLFNLLILNKNKLKIKFAISILQAF